MNTDLPKDSPDPRALHMVRDQLEARGLHDPRVLAAMAQVDRAAFVPLALQAHAYEDRPLPIGHGQTISQPYMVACMTALLALTPTARVLEIGTGSGYQSAVLASLAAEVHTLERHAALAEAALERFRRLGIHNVTVHHADGSLGWPARDPYDAILVTAAAPKLPEALLGQLADGGVLVCPVGDRKEQQLVVVHREGDTFSQRNDTRCVFVPLIGAQGWQEL